MSRRLLQKPLFAFVVGIALIGAGAFVAVGDFPFKPVTSLGFGAILCAMAVYRWVKGKPLSPMCEDVTHGKRDAVDSK